jgi:hypothetical protein
VTDRESFLLRSNPMVMEALRRWARDELRSVNGQIEYVLRRALTDAGRLPKDQSPETEEPSKTPLSNGGRTKTN